MHDSTHRPARMPPASAQATAAGGAAAAAAPAQPERGAKFRALKEKEAAAKEQQVPSWPSPGGLLSALSVLPFLQAGPLALHAPA